MNKSKVIQIIGLPIIPSDTIRKEWTLTKEVKGIHPMIWLGFDDEEKLEKIMIKYYDYMDDYSIYGLVKESDGLKHWGCNNEQELSEFNILKDLNTLNHIKHRKSDSLILKYCAKF